MAKAASFTYVVFIGASITKVWNGLIDGELTKEYVYGTRFQSKLKRGAPYAYLGEGDFKVVDGEVLELERDSRLVLSWKAHYDESVEKEKPSRVAFTLEPAGDSTTKLRVVHDECDEGSATYAGSLEGWPLMLSSLKSLLETGRPLEVKQA